MHIRKGTQESPKTYICYYMWNLFVTICEINGELDEFFFFFWWHSVICTYAHVFLGWQTIPVCL